MVREQDCWGHVHESVSVKTSRWGFLCAFKTCSVYCQSGTWTHEKDWVLTRGEPTLVCSHNCYITGSGLLDNIASAAANPKAQSMLDDPVPKTDLFFHKILSIQKTNEQFVHWPQYLSNLKCWKIVRNCVTKRCSALKMNRCARPLQFTKSRIHTFSCKHTTYKGKVLLFREAWWVTGHVQTVWVRVCLFVHSRTSVTSMRLKWGWWSLSQHLKREGNTFNLW